MEKKYFVIVQHLTEKRLFLFYVPEHHGLRAGTYVICDTRRGNNQLGICLCDPFEAEEGMMFRLFGTSKDRMRCVKGYLVSCGYPKAVIEKIEKGETEGN